MEHLGFIGVGRMGGPMAGRLLEAGFPLTICDVNQGALKPLAARGARVARHPAELASAVEVVLVSLPTPDVVRAVALGESGVAAGTKTKVFIDLSTSGPRTAIAVAEGLAHKGITAVDAPVSGGITGAQKGTLAVMVSCPSGLMERLQPILKTIGKPFFVGEKPGMGQTMKLANNLLSAAALAVTSEAMVLGAKAGLDARLMIEILNSGSGRNSATEDKFPRCVLNRKFDFGFTTELLYKDVKLCLDEAEAQGIPMLVGNALRQLLAVSKATQGPNSDITEIVKCVERWAGVQVKEKE